MTASIGAGHDLPAEVLRADLLALDPAGEVEIVDALALAGGVIERAITSASFESELANRIFDLEHRLLHDVAVTHRAAGKLGELLAGRTVLRGLAGRGPDVGGSPLPR